MERKIYTPPYQPQSNGRIEGFHNFLKSCLTKHISRNREWDDIAPLTTTSYNWLPNQHSKESPFFVMFGMDALTNLKHLISPKLRYMGMEELILDLEIVSKIYQSQIHNLKLARQCVIEDQRPVPNPNINTGDLVLVRDHTSKSFMPKYKTDYHVICLPIMLCWVLRCEETKFLYAVCMCFIQCCLLQKDLTEHVCAIGVQWGFNVVGGMTSLFPMEKSCLCVCFEH